MSAKAKDEQRGIPREPWMEEDSGSGPYGQTQPHRVHAAIPADRGHGGLLSCGCAYECIFLFDGRRHQAFFMHATPLARGYNLEGSLQSTDHDPLHIHLYMISCTPQF